MVKIFLAPVSDVSENSNYDNSLVRGIPISRLRDFLSITELKLIGETQIVKLWGVRCPHKSWTTLENSDYILFYYKKEIISYARIIHKIVNASLSDSLWGHIQSKISGEIHYWERIMFVDNLKLTKIPFDRLMNLAEYNDGFVVRRFLLYRRQGVDNIVQTFGSIDNFLAEFLK